MIGPDFPQVTPTVFGWVPSYVAVEGVDGVGKTTLVEMLSRHLERRGVVVQRVVEPSPECRGSLLDHPPRSPGEACWRFGRDRREILKSVVAPALRRGAWVLSDRSLFSSFAYQVGGLGLSLNECWWRCWLSVVPAGVPGQVVWVRNNAPDRAVVNADILAPLDGGDRYSDEFLLRVENYYRKMSVERFWNARWLSVGAFPTGTMVGELVESLWRWEEWAVKRGRVWKTEPWHQWFGLPRGNLVRV